MKLPPLQGNLDQDRFFMYAACDHEYFDQFGPTLIASIKQNTTCGVHLHLYNPSAEQIKYCRNQPRVSITFESATLELFEPASAPWLTPPEDPELLVTYKRIVNAMGKGNDTSIQQRIQRTYFACARFIRLQQLIHQNSSVLAIDVDAIVRGNIPVLSTDQDLYIHRIEKKNPRFLAGGIYLPGTYSGYQFLKEYANALKNAIEQDTLHWGIDQDLLENIVPKYRWGAIPKELIDWEMSPTSCIWTAKGTRKSADIFVNELKKYKS